MASGLFLCGETMTVYVDVLIAINVYVDFFLLLCTRKILGLGSERLRTALAAAIGGIYSLSIFLENLPRLLRTALNIAALAVMVLAAFNPRTPKKFVRYFLCFLLVNVCFAGIMLAIWLLVNPDGFVYSASVLYFDIDIKLLCILSVISYIIIRVIYSVIRKRAADKALVALTLSCRNKTVTAPALIDTGHSLKDAFSGESVIIADKSVFKTLTGFTAGELLNKEKDGIKTGFKIRLIPVNTVSDGGMLTAVRIDSVSDMKSETRKNVLLAQSNTPISSDEYSLIISEDFF